MHSTPVPPQLFNCAVCCRGFRCKKGFISHTLNKYGNYNCYKHYKTIKKEEDAINLTKRSSTNVTYKDLLEDDDNREEDNHKNPIANRLLVNKKEESVTQQASILDKAAVKRKRSEKADGKSPQ